MDTIDLLGWSGMSLALAGTQMRTKTTMFCCDVGCSLFNVLYFNALGAVGGVLSSALFLFMSVVGLMITQHPPFHALFWIIYPLILLAAFNSVSVGGWLEISPHAVVFLAAVGKQSSSMFVTRVLLLLSNAPALLYGVTTKSTPYITSTLLFTAFSVFAMLKEWSGFARESGEEKVKPT